MELNFTFRGIELSDDGSYPRAIVDVCQTDDTVTDGLYVAKVRVTLPLLTIDTARSPADIGRAAVQTARQLLHPPALQSWLAEQTAPPAD